MTSPAHRRLQRDFKKIQKEQDDGIVASPQQNNIFLWEAIISGPDNTPWEGGIFKLELKFTQDYPNKPPQVIFVSKMFHPNIYPDGRICLDSKHIFYLVLKNQWSPIYDVSAILTSIRSLLSDPNPLSPANAEAAQIFNDNKSQYERRVKEIVQKTWV